MADLQLHVGGDSHEAQEALHGAGGAAHDAHDSFHELKEKLGELKESFTVGALAADAFEKALEVGKDIIKESIEEYAKAEAAQRQLRFAAGELTEQFEKQAKVIAENLAIKDEDVEHMQTLLLRYGAAPAVIGDAVVAVQNYAAATGQDANSAMMMLIRGIEAGHGSLGRMGVKFQETGDFSKDLANAIEALNKKFGGAAEVEADGMSGRMRQASIAVDELKKSMGELFATIESKLGILAGAAQYIRAIAAGAGPLNATLAGGLGAYNAATGYHPKEEVPGVSGSSSFGAGGGVDVSFGELSMAPTEKALKQSQHLEEQYQGALQKQSDFTHKWMEDEDKFDIEQEEKDKQRLLKQLEAMDSYDKESIKGFEKIEQEHTKDLEKLGEMQFEMFKHQTDQQHEELKKREAMWLSLGERIGTALIDGIFSSIDGKNSEAQNAWKIAGDLTRGIFQTVLSVVTQYMGVGFIGQGFNSFLNADVQSASQFGSASHAGSWQRYHGGGWPGLYHDERPAILQVGERVLSRGEVSRMGGAGAVDSAARGGGTTLNVYAWDSENMLDTFAKKGGRAMLNTVRTGRGPMRELLGAG